MNDTSTEIRHMQIAIAKRMTANERIAMACEMYMSTRKLILGSLPTSLTKSEKLAELYKRLYGEKLPDDFFDQHPPKD